MQRSSHFKVGSGETTNVLPVWPPTKHHILAVLYIYLSVSLVSILISHLKGESSSLLQIAFFNPSLNFTKWTNLIIHNNKVHAGPANCVKEKKMIRKQSLCLRMSD